MTEEEKEIVDGLGKIWNKFVKLPEQHPWDRVEFMYKIHDCQRIVAARLGFREMNKNISISPNQR